MEPEKLVERQGRKGEELHWEIQQWKSQFQFMDDELVFIKRLLDSQAFQPLPNLFERLQEYKANIEKTIANKDEVRKNISLHENNLGGMLDSPSSDFNHYRKHDQLQAKIDVFIRDFQNLKTEIFNYTGALLKKK